MSMEVKTKVMKFILRDSDIVYKIYCNSYFRDFSGKEWSVAKLFKNYEMMLNLVKGLDGFEQIVDIYNTGEETSFLGTILKVKYAGEPVTADNIDSVVDAGAQVEGILEILKSLNIVYRDITPGNLLVKDGKLTLVDFEYCSFPGCMYSSMEDAPAELAGPFKSPEGFDNTFSFREIWRGLERKLVLKEDVLKAISLIASKGYRDGSSVWGGVTFHPIPFSEFSAIRSHKIGCYAEYDAIKNFIKIKKIPSDTVLDLGSSVGFFSFSLNKDFGSKVLGVEKDSFTGEVAQLLAGYYERRKVKFQIGDALEYVLDTDKVFDVALCLNTHMWMYKQHKPEKTMRMMKCLSKVAKHLFFQTAHAESASMYIVEELKNKESLIDYLKEAGFEGIEPIFESTAHDNKLRILFYACGKGANGKFSFNSHT